MIRLITASAVAFVIALAALVSVPVSGAAAVGCKTSGLVVWIDTQGNGTAGSIFYTLKFTNQSGQTCTLKGYPGVSAVDLLGHALGSAADRATSPANLVTLANGATANAVLQIAEAGNFPASTCHQTNAAGLRVYPPNQTVAKVVPLPFYGCLHTGAIYLHVRAVTG
jgi:Protein of unknown function (DUF4232)